MFKVVCHLCTFYVCTAHNVMCAHTHECTKQYIFMYMYIFAHMRTHARTAPPGPVTYRAQPDSNSSIFIDWDELRTPNTNPLLLTYELYLYDVVENRSLGSSMGTMFGPFPTFQRNFIVSGLEANAEYWVAVVGVSLVGRGVANGRVSVKTFPNGELYDVRICCLCEVLYCVSSTVYTCTTNAGIKAYGFNAPK